VSILPGSEGRRDPERAEAARRQSMRFARDIGDEQAQAWAHEPRRPPRRFTKIVFVVVVLFAGIGAIPLLLHRGSGGLLEPDCDTVRVDVGPNRVADGGSYAWQVTGPEAGDYVIAVDAESVSVTAGRTETRGGTVLAGPITLPGCRSRQTVATAPAGVGAHQVAVFRRTDGGWERAAIAIVRVID
jgi:hypothetical protein